MLKAGATVGGTSAGAACLVTFEPTFKKNLNQILPDI
jgi:hypothetical protein